MNKIIIIAILILAAVLRFNQLNSLPSLNADEAAVGYNAYSLLITGKDEHGNPWPVHFQSFNDYKPGLYFYIVLPFVKLLGLNESAVRIPGAFLGVATVFLIWLLVRELFPNEKNLYFPELSALFLAISPWHIHFSRGGWEVNVATFFITLGFLLFLKSQKNTKLYFLAFLSFVLSLYTYHAARVIVPLLCLGLFIIYKKVLYSQIKTLILVGIFSFIILIPLLRDLTGPVVYSRVGGVGLLADTGPFWRINQQRGEHSNLKSPFAVIVHNKPVNYTLAFLENYFKHFSGEFLFLSGDDIQRNKVPQMGQMYILDLIFLFVGFVTIARKPVGWGPVILWLFIAPIPAGLTFQSPHALRSQNMVIPLVIVSAFGFLNVTRVVIQKFSLFIRIVFLFLFFIIILWDFTRYLHQYYFHMNKTYNFSSQYGIKELVNYIDENKDKYSKILITDRYDQPYILFLFYMKYSPNKFQSNHELTNIDQYGFSTVREFDKFVFKSLSPWDKVRPDYPMTLIAGTDTEIPNASNIIKRIYFPSGEVVFKIVAN